MNKERLKKLYEVISLQPENFHMQSWFTPGEENLLITDEGDVVDVETVGEMLTATLPGVSCGTTMCIGGWAVLLWGADADPNDPIEDAAGKLLELEYDEQEELFNGNQNESNALYRLKCWAED